MLYTFISGGFSQQQPFQKNKSEKRMSLTRKDVIQLLYPNLPLDEASANDHSISVDGSVKAGSGKVGNGKNSSSSRKRGKVVYSSDESGSEQDFEGNSDNDSVGELDVDTLLYESITGNASTGRKSMCDSSDHSSEEDTEPQCVDNTLCAVDDSANYVDVHMSHEDAVVKEITDSVLLRTMKQLGTEVSCLPIYIFYGITSLSRGVSLFFLLS